MLATCKAFRKRSARCEQALCVPVPNLHVSPTTTLSHSSIEPFGTVLSQPYVHRRSCAKATLSTPHISLSKDRQAQTSLIQATNTPTTFLDQATSREAGKEAVRETNDNDNDNDDARRRQSRSTKQSSFVVVRCPR